MGTDFQGRDILSRLIFGARTSIIIGLLGTVFAGAIGVTLGIISGYMGGLWDLVIMRVVDAKLALPSLVFGIFLAATFKPGLWTIILILVIVFWTRYARVIRGEVLSLRERDFVKLAEARPTLISERWTLTVAPGLCIMLLVLSANLLGDWLRVRMDPQLRNR